LLKFQKMILYPNAKINIGLSVISKRSDGFHNIETVFYPISLCDILTVEPYGAATVEKLAFTCEGIAINSSIPYDNLCCKAYRLLDADFDLPPTSIRLHKTIPAGAGLGGGSSDASHTLLALNDLYNLNISEKQMSVYASRLGSDCAFFLQRFPALGTGKGDILKPVNLSLAGYHIFLVKPPVLVDTADAYSAITPWETRNYLPKLLEKPVSEWRNTVINDFEASVFKKYPETGKIKEQLYAAGAVYASMSGSGSCVYGIFSEKPAELSKLFPDCFCRMVSNSRENDNRTDTFLEKQVQTDTSHSRMPH
jgi:4-diphosphocytidyl-2-C-methyl-D-erythritol kinase